MSLILMSTLYNALYVLCTNQLTSDHGPACMCHCIFFRINPRVSKYHALCLHCVTWWQLGLSSKEDICVSLCQLLVESWQGRSLSDSQQSYNSDVIFMREQVCSLEEVHCGSVRVQQGTVAQVTQGQHPGCIIPLKGII